MKKTEILIKLIRILKLTSRKTWYNKTLKDKSKKTDNDFLYTNFSELQSQLASDLKII